MARRRAIVAVASAAGLLASAGAQTPYRVTTELVPVFATVTDRNGRLVTGLVKDDFEVKDDGRRQPIAVFSRDAQPITIVVMLDRSGSVINQADVVQRAAEKFVERLRPDDRARVGAFAQTIQMLPSDFTSNRRELVLLLREGLQEDQLGPSPVWTAMDRAVRALARATTRRVVLVFTDGHDDPGVDQARTRFEDLVHMAVANDVMVYAIAVPGTARRWTAQVGSRTRSGGATVRRPDPRLKKVAESGGGYVELDPARDLETAFTRVADELHEQYTLAFRPERLDGRRHEIDVKIRGADATVRARRSYVADPMR